MKRKIVSVTECKYDGYYVARIKEGSKDRTICYEGRGLLPQDVKDSIDRNGASVYEGFYHSLI